MNEENLEYVRANVRDASTEDLLDRATIYRKEMDADALVIIDTELVERGVTIDVVKSHLDSREGHVLREDGTTVKCNFCDRPAVEMERSWGWGWNLLFRKLRLSPPPLARCAVHSENKPPPQPPA